MKGQQPTNEGHTVFCIKDKQLPDTYFNLLFLLCCWGMDNLFNAPDVPYVIYTCFVDPQLAKNLFNPLSPGSLLLQLFHMAHEL